MKQSIIYSIFFMGIGLFSVIASSANWDYFFNHRKAQLFLKLFGRTGARIFYVVLGLGVFLIGLLNITGIISLG
jgi:hypothetical protein